MTQLDKELAAATYAVQKTSYFVHKIQMSIRSDHILKKEDLSPVTLADYCAQVILNDIISNEFPNDEIMGEESNYSLKEIPHFITYIKKQLHTYKDFDETQIINLLDKGQSRGGGNKRFWAIDPIDGTKGFIRNEQYAVAVSLIDHGIPVIGILGCPRLFYQDEQGVILAAVKGQGCRAYALDLTKESLLKVSEEKSPHDVIYCEPHGSSQTHSHSKAAKIAMLLHANPHPFQMDSQCKYALLALGKASIYLRLPEDPHATKEKVWDHAAGLLVVEEAGGKVSDAFGANLDFSTGQTLSKNIGVIATNGLLHSQVIEASKQIMS